MDRFPPDSAFSRARGGRYDIMVAMYHDQDTSRSKPRGLSWIGKPGGGNLCPASMSPWDSRSSALRWITGPPLTRPVWAQLPTGEWWRPSVMRCN